MELMILEQALFCIFHLFHCKIISSRFWSTVLFVFWSSILVTLAFLCTEQMARFTKPRHRCASICNQQVNHPWHTYRPLFQQTFWLVLIRKAQVLLITLMLQTLQIQCDNAQHWSWYSWMNFTHHHLLFTPGLLSCLTCQNVWREKGLSPPTRGTLRGVRCVWSTQRCPYMSNNPRIDPNVLFLTYLISPFTEKDQILVMWPNYKMI